ncbi:hypothetical protein Tco_1029451 [Tanacetum coccineum]|uniref:Uncharacterized protein n=1 Tax=Tanacetum coccineum TaxID=301880 RepID=A0ABQ5G3S7_9ASTR
MLPSENINEYYVLFHKLVNDMRNIIMIMPNIQLNFKFVNNMLPEWDRRQNQNQRYFARGNGAAGNGGAHNRDGMPMQDKMLLMQAQENGAVLDEEELLFLAGEQANAFDVDVVNQPLQDLDLNEDNILQADECDAFNRCATYSTMENNKIIEETVTTLKQEFKQKESKFLTDFSNLKHLNDKLENKLHSQDQSIQTVHMMLNPTQVYDQKTKTALGAQNPFYLRQAKRAQPALYDGEELLKTHHVPVIIPSSEEDLELAETTRNKLHAKMNDSACVEKRVNITPPNYSKENFMATFTPQTQLTPEQVAFDLLRDALSAIFGLSELKFKSKKIAQVVRAWIQSKNSLVKHFKDRGFAAVLAVLVTEASQSRQHVDTSLIHIESRKTPTKSLFDVGSSRISIVIVNTKEYHSDVLAVITRIIHRTF